MPTWSGILDELGKSSPGKDQPPDFDGVRRKYLVLAHQHTGRNVILYATKWTQPQPGPPVPEPLISIVDEDLQGIMEVVHGLSGPDLDLILHSPGGSLAAAESVVMYLRSKFNHIRVIVPQLAMSAATIIACAADALVLGKHSFLGPIDPQVTVSTKLGLRMVPAQAILEQFKRAQRECEDPNKLGAWLPMLDQYGPDLLMQCDNASKLSEELVRKWLAQYMLKGDRNRATKARRIAKWLSNHKLWKSHGRHIPRSVLENKGLNIEHLEQDQQSQDLFLSVFHATTHTFSNTTAVKIIENHLGMAFIRQFQSFPIQVPRLPPGFTPGL